ncbi:MAG: DUF488 family protein [Gammaproteobacteria bacterium]
MIRRDPDHTRAVNNRPPVWTAGHSTRPISEFIALLQSAAITIVGDVRRFPGSRRYPQYNQSSLIDSLASAGIDYLALPELGGRRKPWADSPHTAWRNASFRAYADYMDTDAFRQGVDRVLALAGHQRMALMCSEAVWWRCHRALIADYLKARGHAVIHLLSPAKHEAHPYTSAARIVHGQLSYAEAAS